MARGNCTFRQRDMAAAIRAARAAGIEIAKVEVDKDGKIIIVAGKPVETGDATTTNEWDAMIYGKN